MMTAQKQGRPSPPSVVQSEGAVVLRTGPPFRRTMDENLYDEVNMTLGTRLLVLQLFLRALLPHCSSTNPVSPAFSSGTTLAPTWMIVRRRMS